MLKIGFGYDVHPFEQNRKLIVGGVEIKHPKDIGLYGIQMPMFCFTL